MEQLKAERNIFEILNSNFVVKAYFSFVHDHYLCFAQEYMVGGDLATILKTYTVSACIWRVGFGRDLCETLYGGNSVGIGVFAESEHHSSRSET